MTAIVAAPTGLWPFNRDRIVTGVSGSFNSHTHARGSVFGVVFAGFSLINKMLGRTKTRTRDRMYCQSIRTV